METNNLNRLPNSIEKKREPEYPREFFGLQVEFAKKMAQLLGIPLDEALFEYTNLYGRFNVTRKASIDNPVWQEFVSSIKDGDIIEQTYKFYLKRKDVKMEKRLNSEKFGCFGCEYLPGEECVRVHFGNAEKDGSPLSDSNLSKRMEELKRMFEYIKTNFPDAKTVRGDSWLYNLSKYRRLYPPEYTKNPTINVSPKRFTGLSSWGQFLNQNMEIKSEELNLFSNKLAEAKSVDEAMDSFPLPTLKVETDIQHFYNFYGIK